ncbi:MAG: hypothetical protein EHJ94_01420, partial [Deltaproteobacteria bacterium]
MGILLKIIWFCQQAWKSIHYCLSLHLYFGKSIAAVPDHSIVLFPYQMTTLSCGLAGVIGFKNGKKEENPVDLNEFAAMVRTIEDNTLKGKTSQQQCFDENCLGGDALIDQIKQISRSLKTGRWFSQIFLDQKLQNRLSDISSVLRQVVQSETASFIKNIGYLNSEESKIVSRRIENLKDIDWCLRMELMDNIRKVAGLMKNFTEKVQPETVMIYRQINAVLNSIDRLEVRGRDSAGISLMFVLSGDEYSHFNQLADQNKLVDMIATRMNQETLI